MNRVKANEDRLNIPTPKKNQPLSLLEITAAKLWLPKTPPSPPDLALAHLQTYSDRSIPFNCMFCFFAASHIARERAELEQARGFTNENEYATNNFCEPGLHFSIKCNKNIIKKFMVLHILYSKRRIYSNFTQRIAVTSFAYKMIFRGTNLLALGIPHLSTCYEIFILYLSHHINWLSSSRKYPNEVPLHFINKPSWLVIHSDIRPFSYDLLYKDFSLHSALRHCFRPGVEPFIIRRGTSILSSSWSIPALSQVSIPCLSPFALSCVFVTTCLIACVIIYIFIRYM